MDPEASKSCAQRAVEMLNDYAGLRIVRYPMQPLQRRVFDLRHNLTAYDAITSRSPTPSTSLCWLTTRGSQPHLGHRADIHAYPD
ncbi:MAG TPA: hypothetical protein VK923_16420 [Euzebyales bacterium]|nr:hypothetical protein [Euzebyales bacterium]